MQGRLDKVIFVFGSLILAGAVFVAFYQGVGTGYIFDDITSVLPLRSLQDSPEFFWSHVLSNESGPLGRPISIATFALEQLFLNAGPDLSQKISIGLHALNSLLVFLLAAQVLKVARIDHYGSWALFAAALWALAPQKISSVLYIVQRMTLLSATLSLMALIFYMYARLSRSGSGVRSLYFFLAAFSCFTAPFAKETGVLAVPLIAALEVFLISNARASLGEFRVKLISKAVLLTGVTLFIVVGVRTYLQSEAVFSIRSFDFWYRLMLSPAVLVDYVKQFYVPDTTRMGLFHDDFSIRFASLRYLISLSILAFLMLLVSAFFYKDKISLLAFSVSFFLIGHSIESFYLPLELYFEHRNYLPSVGLTLLLAAMFYQLQKKVGKGVARGIYILIAVYLFAVASSSFLYARYWGSYYTLLQHELRGHPESARANADYALTIAEMGHEKRAYEFIDLAKKHSDRHRAARSLGQGDAAALKVAAACLADAPLPGALAGGTLVNTDDPFRSNILQVFSRMVVDDVCPGADWRAVSDWLKLIITASYESGKSVRFFALRDLALFERELGNFTLAYAYARMASELKPDSGLLSVIKLESAMAAGDDEMVNELCLEVRDLDAAGDLTPLEQEVFSRLSKEARCSRE